MLNITALGQVGYLFEFESTKILIDPYLSDFVAEKFGEEFKRLYPPGIQINGLTNIDYIFITHDHEDHCDPLTLRQILNLNPLVKCICTKSCTDIFRDFNINFTETIIPEVNEKLSFSSFRVKVLASKHPVFQIKNNYSSFIGFMFFIDDKTLYHPGDTIPFELSSSIQHIDIVFLPINERNFFRERDGIIGNMTCREAIQWAIELDASRLIPTHWDLFKMNSTEKSEFDLIAKSLNFTNYNWLESGKTLKI